MDIKTINSALKGMSSKIEDLENLKNEDMEKLSKDITTIMEANDGEIFTFNGQQVNDTETLDFNAIVTSNLSKLNEFKNGGYVDYYTELDKKLGKSKSTEEIEKMVDDRKAKVGELISTIERMGNLNTVIKELTERSKDIDISERLEKKDQESDILYEMESEKVKKFINFRKDPGIQIGIEQLKAIKDKEKIEEDNKKIDKDIAEQEAKRDKVKDSKMKEVHQRNINNLKNRKEGNNKKLEELDKKIGSKKESDIINEIKARIPDNLDKDSIEQAIIGENPESALLDIQKKMENDRDKYENRKRKNSERREQIEIGKNASNVRRTANPITYNADDYTLTDEELADIDRLIEENGDDVKDLRKKIKDDPDKYPIPEGKDLRKQVREWLDEKEGKTRNPFKLLNRMRRVRSGEAQEQYKESLIDEKIKSILINKKKEEKHDEKIAEKRKESAAKTETLDRYGNAFKNRIRQAAMKFSDEKLSKLVKTGNYKEEARNILDTVLEDEAKKDDYDFTH